MSKKYSENKIKVPRFKEESGFYTTPKRSKIMGKIRGKYTKPELAFRKALWATGYKVFQFWESEIKKELEHCLAEVLAHLQKQKINSCPF